MALVRARGVAQLGEACLQRLENAVEYVPVVRVNKARECAECICHIGHVEVGTFGEPCGVKMLIGYEVAEVRTDEAHDVGVCFGHGRHVCVLEALTVQPRLFLSERNL